MAQMYLASDTDLKSVADKIRSKGVTSGNLAFPAGFNSAINALNIGKGLSPAAAAGDIRSGKKAVVNNTTITGTIPDQAATTFNVSGSNQTIAAGRYTTGTQTFRGVTTANISDGNIKKGVNVKVGDAANAGRLKDVTGTYLTSRSELSWVRAIESVTIDDNQQKSIRFRTNLPNNTAIRAYIIYDESYGGPVPEYEGSPYMSVFTVYKTSIHNEYDLVIPMRFKPQSSSYSVRPWLGYMVV